MSELFLSILNMSLKASYVILFVILVRLILKKAPKVISYALWGVAAFRLLIPFSFESMFSLMPRNTNAVPIPNDIIYQQSPQINSGIEVVDSFVSKSLPTPTIGASVNPLQIYVEIGAYIWILGIIALLVYSLVSILILKRQLKSAKLIEKNTFEAKNLKTPFVLGLIRPKIYLPMGLNVEERGYILLHEQTHIHRKDHIVKVLAFLTLSVHWFNPLVWIAFMLMSADMELSCDERVLKEMNEDIKKPYANSLLSLATRRYILNGSPLAFGEGNVKGRIKNVLNYRKPGFWVIVFSIVLVTAVGIGLMANPKAAIGGKPIINNTNDVIKITVKTQPGNDSLKTTEDRHQIIEVINYINGLDLKKTTKDVGQNNGMSYIITIYYSNDTSMEYVHFGNAFFIESGNDWYEMPYNQAEKFEAIYNGLSDSFKESEQNKNVSNDDQITSFAREFINKDIVNYESNPKVNIIDSKITRLELIETFDNLADTPIDVYALEYRLLPEDLSKVVMAGGMQIDEDGWLKETCSVGRPFLVVSQNNASAQFIGILWTLGVKENGGLEPSIKELLKVENKNEIAKFVEENLTAIMSSPKEASNQYDYISLHKEEYEKIINIGEKALPYLIEILEGEDMGLRGNIAMLLCEDIIKRLLNEEQNLDPETKKLMKKALMAVDKWNALRGNTSQEVMPEFSEEEVTAARSVVEEYYRAVAAKDSEAILATMYPREHRTMERVKSGNVALFGVEKRTLLSIDYDSQDSKRKSYKPGGKYIELENIIVFKVSFNIDYPNDIAGPWNEDVYDDWSMILIRDSKNSPWLIYDQGY